MARFNRCSCKKENKSKKKTNCQLKVARLNFVQLDKVLQLFARNSFVSTACITSAINQEVRLFSDNHVRIFHCFLSTWTREANKTDWEMQRNKNKNKNILITYIQNRRKVDTFTVGMTTTSAIILIILFNSM